ncbi:MAG: HAMP domain-containing histidine kinase [Bosea sp.]|uniref:sensor histidine kinase n=1 Tax=Bosea sp. 67-29 TaxID=1895723 RepID=UPI000959270E|nr:HAMP domain-containing sensor histidine kinase [Bosea sp. 67-29]MBN9459499.1 HAMP domain-containing histidine kinase [Bosea sp. (in: a-proteobacteria)]OJV06110.1 MAG: two-component sensor histidine kinase [Bosea sp. 67-29]
MRSFGVTEQVAAPARVTPKWRPSLSLIVIMMLTAVLTLPLVSLFFFRIYENQLVHQTEAELIAQSAALSAVIESDLDGHLPPDTALGARPPAVAPAEQPGPFTPILPSLDLARGDLLGRRPDAMPALQPANPVFKLAGERLFPLLERTQSITLTGFRLLDPDGVVIAGRAEVGLSLAHIEEVREAVQGRFKAVLRQRVSKNPPPPLYSLSRGTSIRVFTAMPIIVRGHVAGVLYASRTPSNVFRHLYEERGKVALAGASVALLTILIGLAFHRAITRPVHELIARTTAIGQGDRSAIVPLKHHGTAEFARLAQSFLDMANSLNNRSDFIATFAAHVSHELKSPLTSIEGAAELLRDDMTGPAVAMSDDDRRRFLSNIISDTHRLTAITNRLRELARAEIAPTGGSTELSSAMADIQHRYPALDIRADGALDRKIRISAENIHIILSHLLDNALHHGATRIQAAASTASDRLDLVISDNGGGVSPNNRARIFDSFFTTRRDAGGTGMGLSIVRAMLTAHGGEITLLDSADGAAFTLSFPVTGELDLD